MISIIIVGYNSKKHIDDCLTSIYKSTLQKFRVIFVDNNSSDRSIEYLKKNFPDVVAIESQKNLGFAGGNNLGIKKALELKTDYIFLLNPDTMVDEKCLEKLKTAAKENAIVQPLILLAEKSSKTNLINTSGSYLNFLGISYCNDYKKDADTIKNMEITTASGAASFIPVEVFQKIGYFDECFFMYHEDVDFFWRARMAGFNIKLVTEARVWHKYTFSKGKNKFFHIERNRLMFLFKNFSIKYLLLILPALIINEILMILYSIMGLWFFEKIRSYFSLVQMLPVELRKRKETLKYKATKEKVLKNFLKPSISFSETNNPLFVPYNIFLKLYWAIINKLI